MVVALGFVAVVFGAIDVVLPAVAEFAGRPEAAGSLVAAIAGGSLVGGLVYGGRMWPGTLRERLRVVIVVLGRVAGARAARAPGRSARSRSGCSSAGCSSARPRSWPSS